MAPGAGGRLSSATGERQQVKVWAGRFPKRERLDHYFHETHLDNGGNPEAESPISEFAAGQGEWFYDRDFLEVHFSPEPTTEIRPLLEGHSFPLPIATP